LALKKKSRVHVSFTVNVARALYRERKPCSPGWTHAARAKVGPGEAAGDCLAQRPFCHDLLVDPAYNINLPMWDLFGRLEWDPTRRAGFLGGNEYNYSAPLAHVMEEGDEEEEEEAIVGGDKISG
jgi:hypothetical protein